MTESAPIEDTDELAALLICSLNAMNFTFNTSAIHTFQKLHRIYSYWHSLMSGAKEAHFLHEFTEYLHYKLDLFLLEKTEALSHPYLNVKSNNTLLL